MKLQLDTHRNTKTSIQLGSKRLVKTYQTPYQQDVVAVLSELSNQGQLLKQVSAIEYHTGPGDFTSLRVGATVANILGWILDVPVNGKRQDLNITYQDQK